MPDWIGGDGESTALRYRFMAERELAGISPSYARLCLGVADDVEVIARLDTLPGPKRQPNLLLAAVRFLGGPVSSWSGFRSFVLDRWDAVAATVLERRTQTNEAGRCAVLLPALAALEGPVALLEVGASAGLCLYPDRYGYRYVTDAGEHRVGDGPPVLSCTVTGPGPLPDRRPEIVWRGGLDLDPLDVTDDEDVRWLESLVWPEQTGRIDSLRAAVAVARADPPAIRAGDLTTDLPAAAASAPADATLVVVHSAVLAYVPVEGRRSFAASVAELAGRRPTVWLANEAPGVLDGTGAVATGGESRFVLCRDGHPIATTAPHGQALHRLA
jgi:hypothetical protein